MKPEEQTVALAELGGFKFMWDEATKRHWLYHDNGTRFPKGAVAIYEFKYLTSYDAAAALAQRACVGPRHRRSAETRAKSPMDFYAKAVAGAARDIEYYAKGHREEVDRANSRTEWVRQLRESI